ncbi:MAG: exo-alpha-sialidase, partial [Planctomycetaceae bacterium]|nr:exo-alpha-sialidase [Planctomycetaceae bacterium]
MSLKINTERMTAAVLAVALHCCLLMGHVHAEDPPGAATAETTFQPLEFTVERQAVLEHDDGQFLWFHPRAVAVPRGESANSDTRHSPQVWMTLQKHLRTSDHYSGLWLMKSDDLGKTWNGPTARPELDWVRESDSVDIAVADVTPGWHPATRKILAVGAQIRYSREGAQLNDVPRAHQTAYAVVDPATGKCTKWKRLELPAGKLFEVARSACAQFLVEPDGSVLLPFYIAEHPDQPHSVTVVRCRFDGTTLSYQAHGNVLRQDEVRGLVEPSLVKHKGRYWLTIRHDLKGYVTSSDDGLQYTKPEPWRFDDGTELGSYN